MLYFSVISILMFTFGEAHVAVPCRSYTSDDEIGGEWKSLKISKCTIPNTLTKVPDENTPDVPIDTQLLDLSHQTISTLKENQFISFQNLELFRIASSKISVVENHAFRNMTNLTSITLYNNRISTLPTDIFTDTPNLKVINLGFNLIKVLQKNLFSNLKQLETVHLFYNIITSIETNSFVNVPHLKVLRLHNNKLKSLNLNIISNLISLEELDLNLNPWHCDIILCELMTVYVNTHLWKNIDKKPTCKSPTDLQGKDWRDAVSTCNSRSSLKPGERICGGCRWSDNPLTVVCSGFYQRQVPIVMIKNVVHMNFTGQHDKFTIEEHDLSSFQYLKTLHLEKNQIKTIESNAFKSLKNITTISLAYNKLTIIKKTTFSNLPHLKEVDLSHNEINHLEDKCFSYVPSLETVDLSSNSLKTLKLNIFDNANKLSSLALHNNQLNCDDSACEVMNAVLSRELYPADKEPTCSSPRNLYGKSWSRIALKFLPTITPNVARVTEGNDITLLCSYCFVSRAVWTFNGKNLPKNYQKISNGTLKLILKNIGRDQEGYYECLVKNCDYCESAEVLLNVAPRVSRRRHSADASPDVNSSKYNFLDKVNIG